MKKRPQGLNPTHRTIANYGLLSERKIVFPWYEHSYQAVSPGNMYTRKIIQTELGVLRYLEIFMYGHICM